MHEALSDIDYIDRAKPEIARAVVGSYVEALGWTHGEYRPSRMIR